MFLAVTATVTSPRRTSLSGSHENNLLYRRKIWRRRRRGGGGGSAWETALAASACLYLGTCTDCIVKWDSGRSNREAISVTGRAECYGGQVYQRRFRPERHWNLVEPLSITRRLTCRRAFNRTPNRWGSSSRDVGLRMMVKRVVVQSALVPLRDF